MNPPIPETKAPRLARRITLSQREAIACALFIAPAVLGFLVFAVVPLLSSLWISFTNYTFGAAPRFTGLANYRTIFADPLWWQSVKVTVTYAIVIVPSWLISSLALALIMNQNQLWMRGFRTIYYVPAVLSGVAVAMLWTWILNYKYGLLNTMLGLIGVKGPNWLGTTQWALPSIILMSLWSIGWYLPIWLGGLQGIPTDLYEAAEIDGAGWWGRLRNITLPMLSPVLLYNLVMNIIWATQLFTEPMVMTNGGPQFATLSYLLYLYRNAFVYSNIGVASAMAWVLFLFVMGLTALVFRSTPMWVHYEGERRNN